MIEINSRKCAKQHLVLTHIDHTNPNRLGAIELCLDLVQTGKNSFGVAFEGCGIGFGLVRAR